MTKQQVDILIVGGGLIGGALMLALKNSGYTTLLVESTSFNDKTTADFDARTLALSPASVRILEQLEIWPLLAREAVPIKTIHVSQRGRLGGTRLQASPEHPLGFVAEHHTVNHALQTLLDKKGIYAPAHLTGLDKGLAAITKNHKEEVIEAKLVVAADGAHSSVRRLAGLAACVKEYGQKAIVANIGLAREHQYCAYERFTSAGPMALLPMTRQRLALVWALRPDDCEAYMAMDDQRFLSRLQQHFGYRAGRLTEVGKRVVFPLQQVIMPQTAAWPLVFIGNAAHTLHPVAGQGFNLGLRDAAALAQCIIQNGLSAAMLEQYQTMRRYDQTAISQFTEKLVGLFASNLPGLGLLRSLGLLALDNFSLLQKPLLHHTQGFSAPVSDLICGIEPGQKI